MWLKLLGGVLVVVVGTSVGFTLANRCSERPRQIRQVISCLASLKAYINYSSLPLPDALVSCVNGTSGAVAELFLSTAEILRNNGWMTPQEAISICMQEPKSRLVLEKPERELLEVFGANLGSTSRDEQRSYLDMIQEQLAKIEQDALRARDQNSKMYRYLGVCGGLAVVILLV